MVATPYWSVASDLHPSDAASELHISRSSKRSQIPMNILIYACTNERPSTETLIKMCANLLRHYSIMKREQVFRCESPECWVQIYYAIGPVVIVVPRRPGKSLGRLFEPVLKGIQTGLDWFDTGSNNQSRLLGNLETLSRFYMWKNHTENAVHYFNSK